ncbi:hypothetical protein AB0J86_25770 [Micromonospora sp. NPDC049559]|uniref:hypothetical protein n=1 Tax=Micromonospora sp. NPDC049559 TaxID=3155923 RepID=UPI003447C165
MSVNLAAGPPAEPWHAALAQERYGLLAGELDRVRAAATAWRTGMAGLLAALVGFGLVKGRTDIGQLAPPWPVVTGVLLLAAAVAGGAGALWLLRAAHGRPAVSPLAPSLPGVLADHLAAGTALRDLRRGVAATLACAALLVAAVATTWYGPGKDGPRLRVQQPGSVLCGSVVGVDRGRLTLRTEAGQVTVELGQALTVQPVERCP